MSSEKVQPTPRKSRFYLYLGLFNFLLGVVVGSSPWVLLLFKDSLSSNSPLVFNGGGIAVALITIPLSFVLSVIGIALMLTYRFSKKSVRPEGTPLSGMDIYRLVLSIVFLAVAIWHISDLAGVQLIL
jgi:hypothetical protein